MKAKLLKESLIIVLFVCFICFIISCNQGKQNNTDKLKYPYKIVATVGMVTNVVQNIAKEKAKVEGLIGEGIDPHLYKPTRNDVAALLRADVIFYAGLFLEGKMNDTLVKIGRYKPVYAVTELIEKKYLLGLQHSKKHPDPHVWMDVQSWMKTVQVIVNALSQYDPANKIYYQKNGNHYLKKLQELDNYVKKIIKTIPVKSRILITAHDAFNYFGRAYDIEVLGIQGISTESEAGLDDINSLVDTIVKKDIKAVFVESSVAAKNIKALIEGAQSRGKKVQIGGTLFSDAMGQSGSYEGTYIGMIDHNATIIVHSLGGKAPEKGLNNKLSGE